MSLENVLFLSLMGPDKLHFSHLFSGFLDECSDKDLLDNEPL